MHSDLSSNVKASDVLNTKKRIYTLVQEFKMFRVLEFFVFLFIFREATNVLDKKKIEDNSQDELP